MTMYKIGWLVIALEVTILLIWFCNIFFAKNGTDAAGKGLGQLYVLALAAYIIIGIILMLINNKYCTIAVLIMAALPLIVVVYGLIRYYFL